MHTLPGKISNPRNSCLIFPVSAHLLYISMSAALSSGEYNFRSSSDFQTRLCLHCSRTSYGDVLPPPTLSTCKARLARRSLRCEDGVSLFFISYLGQGHHNELAIVEGLVELLQCRLVGCGEGVIKPCRTVADKGWHGRRTSERAEALTMLEKRVGSGRLSI